MNKDLDVLLDCISYQLDDPSSLSQALLTIARMCTGNDVMKNQLRASKGLGLIQNILTSTRDSKVKEAAMYCLGCAIEKNVFSQKELCSPSMFSILHKTLTVSDLNEKARQVSLFLTICLVANCEMGQFLVRRSGCLQILLQLFVSAFPGDAASEAKGKDILGWVDNGDFTYGRVLWCTVTRALCMCVNNPQNGNPPNLSPWILNDCIGSDTDSRMAKMTQLLLQPYFAFQYLKSCFETEIVQPLTSFIALSVADNAGNKEQIYQCQGLNTLLHALSNAVNEQKALENIICYTNALDAAIMDSRRNAEVCGRLGILGILWKLLKEWDLPLSAKTQLVLTLDHCTEKTERNQLEWVELGGMPLLVELLTQSTDEELSNTVKCILQKCISRDAVVSCRTPSVMGRTSPSVMGRTSFGCSSKEPDSSSAGDKGHTRNDLAMKLEALEQQTNKRFEQLQAILTPCQTQTMQMAVSSKQRERTQERHLALSARIEKTVDTEAKLTDEPGRLLSELTSEKTKQHESSQLRVQQRHLLTETKATKNKSTETESLPKNYVQCRNKEAQQKQSERTGIQCETMPSGLNSVHFFCKNGESAIVGQEDKEGEEEEMEEETMEEFETEEEADDEEDEENVEGDEEEEKEYEEKKDEEEEDEEEKKSLVSNQRTFPSSNINRKLLDREDLKHGECKQGKQFDTVNGEFCGNCKVRRKTEGKKRGCKTNQTSKISAKKETICAMNSEDRSFRDISNRFAVTNTLKANVRISRPLPLDSQHISPKLCANSSHLETNNRKIKNCLVFQHKSQENDHAKLPLEQVSQNSALLFKRPVAAPLRNPTRPQIDKNRFVLQVTPPPSPCQSEFDLELVVAAGCGRGRRVPTSNYQNEELEFPTVSCVVANNACSLMHGKNRPVSLKHGSSASLLKHDNNSRLLKHSNTVCSPKHNNHACSPDHGDVSFDGMEKVNCFSTELSFSKSCSQQKLILPKRKIVSTDRSKEEPTACSSSTAGQYNFPHYLKRKALGEDGKRNQCPGCRAPSDLGFPLLNSRTFNIALETSCHSCSIHRYVRQLERSFAAAAKREGKAELQGPRSHLLRREPAFSFRTRSKSQISEDVYEFNGSSDSMTISSPEDDVTDCESDHEDAPVSVWSKSVSPSKARRVRVPYSQAEEENLLTGVAKLGKFWKQILYAYKFHPSRTAVDLMEKYKRMKDSSAADHQSPPSLFSSASATHRHRHPPLSMAEERRLRRGVHLHGYNWTAILNAYRFAKGRTTQELRDSWRSMHGTKKKSFGSDR